MKFCEEALSLSDLRSLLVRQVKHIEQYRTNAG